MNILRLGGVSLALAGGALALGTLASRPTDAAMSKDKRREIVKAVPLLVTLVQKEGKILGIAGFGSGTTISPKGHILTANHVISFRHPLPEGITVVPDMYVFVTPENNADPMPICTFNPSHMPRDPELDIAMVMCERDLKGNPWDPSSMKWSTVALGDPASMTQGDDIWIFGYPGAGQDPRKKGSEVFLLPTMNVSAGKFAGVINEQDSATATRHISWIKTDAEISGGNSGGCTTDDEGNYLGSPTEVHTDVRDTRNGDGGTVGHVGFIRPTNLFKPYSDMAARGWVPGDATAGPPEQPSGEGVIVTGRIASAETGDPVAGMVVIVFKAGVTAKQVLAAKSPAELMLTRGQSGTDGEFTMASKVPRGKYTVAVIGQGYKLVLEDGALVIDDDTPASYRAWNRIPVTRCKSGADCIQ
jgi:hypothetical protein